VVEHATNIQIATKDGQRFAAKVVGRDPPWLSTIVVLVGAELNSEIEHQTARDSTVGPEKLLGVRGAVMADPVGAAKADTVGAAK
jgi:S1-C subfamily serine protease